MTDVSPEPDAAKLEFPNWFLTVRKIVDSMTSVLNVVGTLLIVSIMLLVNSDVIGRVFFNNPVSGVPEIVSMSIVAIVFLQIAQAFRKGRLTRTEAVLGYIGKRFPRTRLVIELGFSFAAIALIWQLLSASQPLFMKAWVRGTYEGTVGDFTAPIWPVKLIILIGCTALLVQLVLYAVAIGFQLFATKAQKS